MPFLGVRVRVMVFNATFNNLKIFVRTCSTSTGKNVQIIEGGQYLVEVEQALTKIFKLLKASTKY
jgi:chemotaxis protein histidine kinase CheA